MSQLKTGDFVLVLQKRNNVKVRARRQAQSIEGYKLRNPDHKGEVEELLYPDPIPDGSHAVYMGSHVDSLHEALKKKTGPYGINMWRHNIVFHLVFWNGLAVWVSSEDAELEQVK